MPAPPQEAPAPPSLGAAGRVWLQTGLLGFGGPAGQIALLHRSVVEQRKWVTAGEFEQALSFCFLLPGPEAQQLATYLGWRLHGVRGGVLSGTLFWLPGAALLWLFSWIHVRHGTQPDIAAIFGGLRAAVVAVVFAALWRLGRRQLRTPLHWVVAGLGSTMGIWFPLILIGAGILGGRLAPSAPAPAPDATTSSPPPPNPWIQTARTLCLWLTVWWVPLLLPGLIWGWDQSAVRLGFFFSQTALWTFGGAYAVLPYVGATAEAAGWVTPAELLDGLALGETTPGPLVLVLQWIGFLAGWKQPAPFTPLGGASLAAFTTSWATFAPSFLWIFAGAPWLGRLSQSPGISRFLQGIGTAVVGLVASLAVRLLMVVWFPRADFLAPDLWAIGLSLAAAIALLRFRWPVAIAIAACGLANWIHAR